MAWRWVLTPVERKFCVGSSPATPTNCSIVYGLITLLFERSKQVPLYDFFSVFGLPKMDIAGQKYLRPLYRKYREYKYAHCSKLNLIIRNSTNATTIKLIIADRNISLKEGWVG